MSNNYLDREDILEKIVSTFISKGKRKVFGGFRVEGDELIYRSEKHVQASITIDENDESYKELMKDIEEGNLVCGNSKEFIQESYKIEKQKGMYYFIYRGVRKYRVIIAKRINDIVFGNSSTLDIKSIRTLYSREPVQEVLERTDGVIMVPFNIFREANLDINTLTVIEKAPSEMVSRIVDTYAKEPVYESVHFTGAALIKCESKCFLFDIDRNEIKHNRFNPFVAELPKMAKSIKEAYSLLMPEEVIKAEKKRLPVKRQGEWFFIPVSKSPIKDITEREWLIVLATESRGAMRSLVGEKFMNRIRKQANVISKKIPYRRELEAGGNRPNIVEYGVEINGKIYCKGEVKHTGREHEPIMLKTWHMAVPNTAVKSFQISGDID